jgi:hypothetical protein
MGARIYLSMLFYAPKITTLQKQSTIVYSTGILLVATTSLVQVQLIIVLVISLKLLQKMYIYCIFDLTHSTNRSSTTE